MCPVRALRTHPTSRCARIDDVTSLSDHQLVKLARRGSGEAVAVLYQRHLPLLLYESRTYAGRESEPLDLVHEAWVRILSDLHRFTLEKSFIAWAVTVLRNLGRDQVNSRSRHRDLMARRRPDLEELIPETTTPDPLADYRRLQTGRLLEEELTVLTPRQRRALQLHVGERCSSIQIARVMGCSPPTVRTTCHFALNRLRRKASIQ